jgi:ElaB/YqjD/DUF883 family membrane-anchored ribosome-binding protein
MNETKSEKVEKSGEKNGHGAHGRRRGRAPRGELRDGAAQAGQDPRAAIESFVQELPALARANPVAAVAIGAGAVVTIGLLLRSKLARTLLMLAGGYVVQQLLAQRSDFGLEAHASEDE